MLDNISYDGSGELSLPFLGDWIKFSFKNDQIFKLEAAFPGVSVFRMRRELVSTEPTKLAWILKIIELGLIGGGMSVSDAKSLIEGRIGVDGGVSWLFATNLAGILLTAALSGASNDEVEDEEVGKPTGSKQSPKNP